MENEGRIVELLSEILIKFDQMIGEQKTTNRILERLDLRLEHIVDQLQKLNLQKLENPKQHLN